MSNILDTLSNERRQRVEQGGAPKFNEAECGDLPIQTRIDIWKAGEVYMPTKQYALLGYCAMYFEDSKYGMGVTCTWECLKAHVSNESNKPQRDQNNEWWKLCRAPKRTSV
ncbi:hypothetical protein IW262DRAFT_1497789 [Armillaria fumosa]|nr:hypothetical protein IW262DRAFT_1497789 [Armillaria fumosa]